MDSQPDCLRDRFGSSLTQRGNDDENTRLLLVTLALMSLSTFFMAQGNRKYFQALIEDTNLLSSSWNLTDIDIFKKDVRQRLLNKSDAKLAIVYLSMGLGIMIFGALPFGLYTVLNIIF